ncbi:2'-5' RNA ligase family protein [Nocardia suismassiliense]|uniref:2'-5' RNA ligase family protein n=1 Tax=Nocardia suismassiliense TaxID=2077092 RepID=UPI000D1DD2A3|nr:2'-5' RNA ligase family protein [Nocardia suismassiliense]
MRQPREPRGRNEEDDEALSRYSDALAAVAANTAPFAIPMQGPWLHDYGAGVAAPEDEQWKQLNTATRDAAEQVFGTERALPAPLRRPHVSLGYGTAERDSAPVELALSIIKTPASLTVRSLQLLAVDVDPEAGVFVWDVISTYAVKSS